MKSEQVRVRRLIRNQKSRREKRVTRLSRTGER